MGLTMKKASEYHLHADECRTLASAISDPERKAMVATMAETWETLAQQREAFLERKMRILALDSRISG
jgi:hypothetical protein